MTMKCALANFANRVIHYACGGISESDVQLASSAKGIVVGFNVCPDSGAANAAKRLGVEIRSPFGISCFNITEFAATSADLAHQHKRRRATTPTLAHVWTFCFLANGSQF